MTNDKAANNGTETQVAPELEAAMQKAWQEVLDVDEKLEEINDELVAEEAKLAAKFEHKKHPLYVERQRMFDKIPRFWSVVIENHPVLAGLVQMEEMDLLSLLKAIEVERDAENPAKFKVHLRFADNDYLVNNHIVREFDLDESTNELVSEVPKIEWKDGKNLTVPPEGEEGSFFHWFTSDDPSVGELIANDLFPNAVRYFTIDEDVEDEDLLSGDEEDLLSEEDDEDDDEEEEDAGAPKKKKSKAE
ncbi:hypothetical protein IWQ61_004326 [Dispira simplex]|nr:hypothetical protein IWQ61_004326 [Dispira simplex]